MKVTFRTNLDLSRAEKWPEELPEVPRVGDLVESDHLHKYYRTPANHKSLRDRCVAGAISAAYTEGPFEYRLELAVVRVTWRTDKSAWEGWPSKWSPEVELHLPTSRWATLRDFYEFYEMVTGNKFI
jgi:hypothetical protein